MEKTSPLKAIKSFCIDCMGGQQSLVKTCTAPNCPLFPFKHGKNPFSKRTLTDEQRKAAGERLSASRNKSE